jgi:hypothetical protein
LHAFATCAWLAACLAGSGCWAIRRAIGSAEPIATEKFAEDVRELTDASLARLAETKARVVALGEPTHGSREPREFHVQALAAFVATGSQFLVLGEWCDVEGDVLNDYIGGRLPEGSRLRRIN